MLVIPVRVGDSLRDGILGKDVIEERGVRFVGVIGRVPVWDERRRTTNAMESKFKEWKRAGMNP